MAGKRFKNIKWNIAENPDGSVTIPHCQLALLMDIRDELQTLNRLLHCYRFVGIPTQLEKIVRNTTKRRRKKS